MEKYLLSKWKEKEAGVAIVESDKQTLNQQIPKETKKGITYGKGINAAKRVNYPEYICTQYRSTQIYKANS